MLWNTETDNFGFQVTLKQKPMIRSGLLSIISSVYDPLGLAAPFLLEGKLINQELSKANLGWDEVIAEKIQIQWTKWEKNKKQLQRIVWNVVCIILLMSVNIAMEKYPTCVYWIIMAEFIVA